MTNFAPNSMTMVSVFDDMTQVSEIEVLRMFPLVHEQRRKEALRYKHVFGQFACLKSWLMLADMLRPLGVNDFEMDFNEHGKPFLKNHPGIHFNLSHCKNGIAVAVDLAPIGIDIESFRKDNIALVRRTMNTAETAWIRGSSAPIEMFTRFWTQKEAVLKLRGTGIIEDLHQVLNGEGYRIETHVNHDKCYVWSVAYAQ